MSHPAWLQLVPKWLGIGVLWIGVTYWAGSWLGVAMSPRELIAGQRAEVIAVTNRAQQAEQAIYLLQWQQQQTQQDMAEVKAKLDEMAMVLYSLERRSR